MTVRPLRGLRESLSFLTTFGGGTVPTPRALPWFPVTGALVGGGVGLTWWAAAQWFPLPVAAALALLVDLGLTGLLHLDGLADSADGLLPPLARTRRLEVMADPRAGAFGVITVVAVMLLRFAALSSIPPEAITILVVAAIWSTTRTVMAIVACTVPYARSGGIATSFLGSSAGPIAVIGVALASALGALGTDGPARGILAVVATALAATTVVTFARGRIGGFTGDVLGAAGVIGETVGLVMLTVRS